MLSASKLYQSVSTSGPSATVEAHADEHVLELVPGLGHQVEVARATGADRAGPRSGRAGRGQLGRALGAAELGAAGRQQRLERGPGLVRAPGRAPRRSGSIEPPSARCRRSAADALAEAARPQAASSASRSAAPATMALGAVTYAAISAALGGPVGSSSAATGLVRSMAPS